MAKMEYGYLIHVLTTVDNPTAILRTKKEALFGLIPELRACESTVLYKDRNPTDIFTHTLSVVKNTPKESLVLRLAALFHDVGKPRCYSGNEKYSFHGSASKDIFVKFAAKNNLDPALTETVSLLVYFHDLPVGIDCYHLYLNQIIQNFDEERMKLLFKLKEADFRAKLKDDILEKRLCDLDKVKGICLDLRRQG